MTTWQPYNYWAQVLTVHDGDTYDVNVDLGMFVHVVTSIRLLGCNCIELADPGGAETRAFVQGLIDGRTVMISTVKPDKYGGRWDATVALPDGRDLTSVLVAAGWATAWNGRGPKPVPAWPLQPPAVSATRPFLTGP